MDGQRRHDDPLNGSGATLLVQTEVPSEEQAGQEAPNVKPAFSTETVIRTDGKKYERITFDSGTVIYAEEQADGSYRPDRKPF